MRDVSKLWSAGYALGASFENTVVIAENRVLNAEGTRFRRRIRPPQGGRCHRRSGACPARRCIGAYRSVRGGHKLNHAVLTALMADPQRLDLCRNARKAGASAAMPTSPPASPPRPTARTSLN